MLRTRTKAGFFAGVVLSLFFAVLLGALHSFDLYVEAWTPRIGAPTKVTLRVPYGPRIVRSQNADGSSVAYGHGRIIIPAGTSLSEQDEEHRAAIAFDSLRRPPSAARLGAYAVIHFTLGLLLTVYLRRFGQSRVRLLRTQIGLFLSVLVIVCVVKLLLLFTGLSEFWVPVAALPLWISLAFDRRTGFLLSIVLAFVVSSFLRFDLVLLMVVLVRGMAATLLFLDRKHPKQMLPAGALAGLVACGLYAAIAIIFEGKFDLWRDLSDPARSVMLANFGGGAVSGVAAVLLRDFMEKLLGVVSRDKLLDLTDLEQPLLQKLAREAPGTWEHARAMANLAEAAASAIGADGLLVRVGAYYHDVGKTVQPQYFAENLPPGEESPHGELEPEVSADAIMAHVVLGTKMLRDAGIPESVVEFTYTHHGTQTVEYFWHRCQEAGNPKSLTEDYFRYPGMRPQTKETAILMLVDSIEAASRTVDPPTREKFEEMLQRILFSKLKARQLDESGLTVADLRTLVIRMGDTLSNMFHHRVRYPWQEARKSSSPASSPGGSLGLAAAPPSSPDSTPPPRPEHHEESATEPSSADRLRPPAPSTPSHDGKPASSGPFRTPTPVEARTSEKGL